MFSQAFIRAINFVLSPFVEGGLSLDPEDDGNWTGGKKDQGELRGTKWGISAEAYPQLDIGSLTRDDAVLIYWRDYWAKMKGDLLPPRVALVVFDAAVNQGVDAAAKMLQRVLGVVIDGDIGPVTLTAARGKEQDDVVVEFLGVRAMRYASGDQAKFKRYGRGWMNRLFRACMEASR